MKRSIFYILFFCFLFLATPSFAQEDLSEYSKNGGAAKVLFLDHGATNGIDSLGITNGLELAYWRQISDRSRLAIPLKISVAEIAGFLNNRTLASLDAIVQFDILKSSKGLSLYALAGGGLVVENFDDSNLQFPVGVGANIPVSKGSFVTAQAEYRLSTQDDRSNLQFGIGYAFKLPKDFGESNVQDRDKDGISDDEDKCPDTPGVITAMGCPDNDGDGITNLNDACPDEFGPAESNGCPDTDGDGIADNFDKCPDEPGKPSMDGCPEPDTDGDGVVDSEDDCPTEKGVVEWDGCPDTDGDGIVDRMDDCPTVKGSPQASGCPDQDNDGIADSKDKCPELAGPEERNGCPFVDTDGDGVADESDNCPNSAGPASNAGCPQISQEVQTVLAMAASNIQFETGKETLLTSSYPIMDQIATIMRQYPDYSLSISGHTDAIGNDANNMLLSQNRALTCYNYLVTKGIDRTRISHAGYGETQPLATNDTVEGRAMNRRVAFQLFVK